MPCFQDGLKSQSFAVGEDSLFALAPHMGLPGTIFHFSSTLGVVGCFIVEDGLKLLVLLGCDQGQELQQFSPGFYAFSLGVLVSLGCEVENEWANVTLMAIKIFFHSLRHHHILAGCQLAICLQFHPALVNFQLVSSILAHLT